MPDPSLVNRPDVQELATAMPVPISRPPAMSDTGVNGSPVFSPCDQAVRYSSDKPTDATATPSSQPCSSRVRRARAEANIERKHS